jgi:class 3 adenylate cyclase
LTESYALQTSGGSTTNVGVSGDDALKKRSRHDGERRHLTVLFCDLVGSTGISAQLDPEEWRETVAGYQRAAAEAITRFDGRVAKYLGDGVIAYSVGPRRMTTTRLREQRRPQRQRLYREASRRFRINKHSTHQFHWPPPRDTALRRMKYGRE